MSDDLRIETLGHDSLAVSQENLHSVEKSTVPGTLQNESQELEMQGHLPECPCAQQPEPSNHWHDHGAACEGCICAALRACEQRVLGLRLDDLNIKSFNAALDAAIASVREAIGEEWQGKIVPKGEYDCCGCSSYDGIVDDAVSAIRVLKEKP